MLGRNLPRSPGAFDALTASVPFLPSIRQRSLKQNFTQVIRGRGTEFLKNARAVWYAKTSQQLCPVVRIGTVWPALSSGDALPMGAFVTRGQSMVQAGGRNFLPQRRAFTAHFWVVRISRLIGNSDTTASCIVWQVASSWESGTIGTSITRTDSAPGSESPRHTKRRSLKERRFAFPCWSLASQQITGGGCIHRAYRRLSWPVSPFQGRSWADALAGRLLFFWGWPGYFPAAGTSLAPSI